MRLKTPPRHGGHLSGATFTPPSFCAVPCQSWLLIQYNIRLASSHQLVKSIVLEIMSVQPIDLFRSALFVLWEHAGK